MPTLLIIPAWLSAPRQLRTFYIPFLLLLVVALLVVFSPNDYDNLKLMVYWYAVTAVLVAIWLCRDHFLPLSGRLRRSLRFWDRLRGFFSLRSKTDDPRLWFRRLC